MHKLKQEYQFQVTSKLYTPTHRLHSVTSLFNYYVSYIFIILIFVLACGGHCDDCSDTDYEVCTACAGDLYLYEDDCRACPKGHYGDGSNECQPCNDNCLACTDDGTSTVFDTCECDLENKYVNLVNNQCIDDCEAGYEVIQDTYCTCKFHSTLY